MVAIQIDTSDFNAIKRNFDYIKFVVLFKRLRQK